MENNEIYLPAHSPVEASHLPATHPWICVQVERFGAASLCAWPAHALGALPAHLLQELEEQLPKARANQHCREPFLRISTAAKSLRMALERELCPSFGPGANPGCMVTGVSAPLPGASPAPALCIHVAITRQLTTPEQVFQAASKAFQAQGEGARVESARGACHELCAALPLLAPVAPIQARLGAAPTDAPERPAPARFRQS